MALIKLLYIWEQPKTYSKEFNQLSIIFKPLKPLNLPQATTLVGEEIVKVYVLLPNQGLQPHSHDEPEEIHVG